MHTLAEQLDSALTATRGFAHGIAREISDVEVAVLEEVRCLGHVLVNRLLAVRQHTGGSEELNHAITAAEGIFAAVRDHVDATSVAAQKAAGDFVRAQEEFAKNAEAEREAIKAKLISEANTAPAASAAPDAAQPAS